MGGRRLLMCSEAHAGETTLVRCLLPLQSNNTSVEHERRPLIGRFQHYLFVIPSPNPPGGTCQPINSAVWEGEGWPLRYADSRYRTRWRLSGPEHVGGMLEDEKLGVKSVWGGRCETVVGVLR